MSSTETTVNTNPTMTVIDCTHTHLETHTHTHTQTDTHLIIPPKKEKDEQKNERDRDACLIWPPSRYFISSGWVQTTFNSFVHLQTRCVCSRIQRTGTIPTANTTTDALRLQKVRSRGIRCCDGQRSRFLDFLNKILIFRRCKWFVCICPRERATLEDIAMTGGLAKWCNRCLRWWGGKSRGEK